MNPTANASQRFSLRGNTQRNAQNTVRLATALACVMGLTACSETLGPKLDGNVKVAFTTKSSASAASNTSLGGFIVATTQDTMVITKAQMVLSRVELSSSANAACSVDISDQNCHALEQSYVLVDLPIDGSVRSVIGGTIPAGTYTSLEANLRAVHSSDGAAAAAFIAAHPEFKDANVRVTGKFRGVPFVFTTAVNGSLDLAFNPSLTTDGNGLDLTVNVGLDAWFRNATGALIDPSLISSSGFLEAVVASNISGSFRAFEDANHDGVDDHGDAN